MVITVTTSHQRRRGLMLSRGSTVTSGSSGSTTNADAARISRSCNSRSDNHWRANRCKRARLARIVATTTPIPPASAADDAARTPSRKVMSIATSVVMPGAAPLPFWTPSSPRVLTNAAATTSERKRPPTQIPATPTSAATTPARPSKLKVLTPAGAERGLRPFARSRSNPMMRPTPSPTPSAVMCGAIDSRPKSDCISSSTVLARCCFTCGGHNCIRPPRRCIHVDEDQDAKASSTEK